MNFIQRSIIEFNNVYKLINETNIIDKLIEETPDPRSKFFLRLFGPLFIFLYNYKISPSWLVVILLLFLFYFVEYKKFKKENKKSNLFYLGLFLLGFSIIGSIIIQISMCTKIQ
jgi:hypothetical protein